MRAIGLLDLQALVCLSNLTTLTIDLFLCLGMHFLGQRQTLLLRFETHFALFDTIVSERQELLPARIISDQLFGLFLPMHPVLGQLLQPAFVFAL